MRFRDEILPIQSPLLRESLLVSFPPLNNRLNFSGGKETHRDSLSKGDRNGKSSSLNPNQKGVVGFVGISRFIGVGPSLLESSAIEGDSPVRSSPVFLYKSFTRVGQFESIALSGR